MYQWINPSSGNTQLSGNPPTWYRSPQSGGGPRVLVFERGKVIDDTAIAVPEGTRDELRSQAFQARESTHAATTALEVSAEEEAETVAADSTAAEAGTSERDAVVRKSASGELTEMDADTVGRLKDIISAWDRMKLEQAKELIRGAAPNEPNTPQAP